MIKAALAKLKKKGDLSREETEAVFGQIMKGSCRTEDIVSLLALLKAKKETIEEITGAASIMRKFAAKVQPKNPRLLDTCGTGGDSSNTFNISTVSAFVASGAGAAVAKHGNVAVSSKCGSADLLRELGVNIDAGNETVERCIDEIGIGFLFAPRFHPAMKYAMPARKMLKARSIFNILGPLTNPAGAKFQLLGVYDGTLAAPLANVLKNLGSERAIVAHGKDGLDEITVTAETEIAELKAGKVRTYRIKPEDFGFKRRRKEDLAGRDARFNAGIALEILSGKKGPRRDIVTLNAGAAIYVTGITGTLKEAIARAEESVDSGRALEKLEKLKELTNK